jgi:hypothetical protein
MVWWKKYATPAAGSPNITIKLEKLVSGSDYEGFYVEIQPGSKIRITQKVAVLDTTVTAGYTIKSEIRDVLLPKGYGNSEFSVENLIVLFSEKNIILGFDSLDNALVIPIENYQTVVDASDMVYQYVTSAGCTLKVSGDGSALIGFTKLTYATTGSFTTPIYYPGYIVTTSLGIDKKAVIPTGAGLSITYHGGGSDIDTEEVTASDAEKQGVYFNAWFTGSGNVTPIYYKIALRQAPTRISMSGSAQELATQIIEFKQTLSGSKDGSFSGGNITATVSCEAAFYPNIFMARSPQVAYYLQLIGQSAETLRDTHYIDIKEVSRPENGQFLMDVCSRDITKELELTPMLESTDYDRQIQAGSWKHTSLMSALADRAGVTLTATAAAATDPVMPYVVDDNNAMWQFQRSASLWECMNRVRDYSGWLLYPNSSGALIYKPRPTTATTEDYTWDCNALPITDIRYKLIDLYRTRFLVRGKAGADNTGAYPYKKGDNILGMGYHAGLETQLGRSRVMVILDQSLNDWDSIERTVDAVYDYYTGDPFYVSFTLNLPETYPALWLYQIIKWSDSTMEWDGSAIANKKFMITSLDFAYTGGEGSCRVEAVAL